jgi:hypothetical protein
MQIKKVNKDKRVVFPDARGQWIFTVAPKSGIVIYLDAKEQNTGGVFISDIALKRAGYVCQIKK